MQFHGLPGLGVGRDPVQCGGGVAGAPDGAAVAGVFHRPAPDMRWS